MKIAHLQINKKNNNYSSNAHQITVVLWYRSWCPRNTKIFFPLFLKAKNILVFLGHHNGYIKRSSKVEFFVIYCVVIHKNREPMQFSTQEYNFCSKSNFGYLWASVFWIIILVHRLSACIFTISPIILWVWFQGVYNYWINKYLFKF